MSLREKESSIVCLKVSASVVVDESNPLHSVRVRGENERSVPFNLCVRVTVRRGCALFVRVSG